MDPVVRVTGGLVRGSSRDGVNSFLGIPYAGPAVGADRYRAPQRVAPWDGERDATAPGPTAAQSAYPPPMDTVLPSSVAPGDDYLNVSVWAPAEGGSLPVMVWIHGGAFVRGANSLPTYNGSAFARDGVVLVAINYRLGVPGFAVLDGAPTNLGLRDQIAALEWVRDNVAAFGGNSDDVTVFGESAGGMSVATLMACPAARGLFHRSVVQSGGGTDVCSLQDARRVSAEVAAHLGVSATAEAFAALDPDAVTAAQSAVALAIQADPDPQRWGATVLSGGLGIMTLFPVIDGELVPDVPLARIAEGSAAGMPLLIGTTREEFRLFLVPTGVAAAVTSEALPLLAARYGWPPQAVETYAANRPGGSPGDIVCAILTDAAFRVLSAHLAAAQHAAGGTVHA
ncbi:MAG: carboxylesterase/lipase family protein, partial [Actinobacteria bacterium]|nr:carboxylesterase/lipase family protein [Actinomycetota bacterium]